MPADSHSRAFFAANRDFVLAQERSHILEPHGTFVNLHAVQFCNSVQQVRSRHAACSAQFVSARFEQIIEGETQNMIRVDKRSIAVENSKMISVAVGREPGQSVLFDYSFLKQPEISF